MPKTRMRAEMYFFYVNLTNKMKKSVFILLIQMYMKNVCIFFSQIEKP